MCFSTRLMWKFLKASRFPRKFQQNARFSQQLADHCHPARSASLDCPLARMDSYGRGHQVTGHVGVHPVEFLVRRVGGEPYPGGSRSIILLHWRRDAPTSPPILCTRLICLFIGACMLHSLVPVTGARVSPGTGSVFRSDGFRDVFLLPQPGKSVKKEIVRKDISHSGHALWHHTGIHGSFKLPNFAKSRLASKLRHVFRAGWDPIPGLRQPSGV